MTNGDVVEFGPTAGTPGTDFGVAGTRYYADATTGAITSGAVAGDTPVGFTVHAKRLVVRIGNPMTAADVTPVTWEALVPEGGIPGTDIADGAIDTTQLADGAVTVDKIGATGTPQDGVYLEGDGSWSAPA